MNRKVNGVVLDPSQGDIHTLYQSIAALEQRIKELESLVVNHLDTHYDDEYYVLDGVE
jgi:hypothetical protein